MRRVLFELDLDAVVAAAGRRSSSRCPSSSPPQRDIAVIVADNVTHDAVLAAVHAARHGRPAARGLAVRRLQAQAGRPLGWRPHEKSLAVRLTLASGEATLTDEQIDAAVKAVVDSIAGRLGGRLRG